MKVMSITSANFDALTHMFRLRGQTIYDNRTNIGVNGRFTWSERK